MAFGEWLLLSGTFKKEKNRVPQTFSYIYCIWLKKYLKDSVFLYQDWCLLRTNIQILHSDK